MPAGMTRREFAQAAGAIEETGLPAPGVPEEGPLALQHHGGYHKGDDQWNPASSLVQFRNIYIKELDK